MSVRRFTAAVLLLVAASAMYVPACEYDQTRPRGGSQPDIARETVPPASPNA
jgi:hypothetical protein